MKSAYRIHNILRPLGWLYGSVTGIRNLMFDRGLRKSATFSIPVISIGNITVGGTGKTPHTEYTAALLKERFVTAVLSRGYKRHTKGFFMSDARSDSGLIGDEPFQIKSRFPDLHVAVCNDRATGIRRLMDLCAPQVVILDDAYQHRKVTPSLNILLVNYNRNILHDAILPAGHLRESAAGRRRADIIIVTKCPVDISDQTMDRMARELAVKPSQKVYFTTFRYDMPYLMDQPQCPAPLPEGPVLAVAGIVSPEPMVHELESQGHEVSLMSYPDHYLFNAKDISHIQQKLDEMGPDSFIVTTAKDAARLTDMRLDEELRRRIYVLPISVRFIRDAGEFDRTVTEHVESKLNNI